MAKVMVSIPDALLARIDEVARIRGTSRSGLLQAAAERELSRRSPEEMRAAIALAREAMRGAPKVDAVAAIREERDRR
jgi:metal-responsive CopG/Arc/MetJ family transcriptional regulator